MPKAKPVLRLSRAALRDLDDIYDYYSAQASPDVAENLLAAIDAGAARVAARPMVGRSRDDLLPNIRSVSVPPYLVFYRPEQGGIEIVRVLHQRRDLKAAFREPEP